MSHYRPFAVGLASLTLLAGAACGGNSNDDAGGPPVPAVNESESGANAAPTAGGNTSASSDDATTELELEARDFSFAPSSLQAPGGAKVTLKFKNEGEAPHTFTAAAVKVDKQLSPGERATITFTMPGSGSVSFVCKLHPTQMKGQITVA